MDPKTLEQLRAAVAGGATIRTAARTAGVHHSTALRALAKIKDKVRTADEFRRMPSFAPPRSLEAQTCWSLEAIRTARDKQMRGHFKTPVQLAKAMGTDDAIFTARRNRAAPQSSLSTRLVPANGARGARVAAKAGRSVHIARKTMHSIATCLADHGVAIGYNVHEPNEDGTCVDFSHRCWPLEHVRWNNATHQLETQVLGGLREPIRHGDGVWTIYSKYDEDPWAHDAAILPAAFVWGMHANGLTDWAAGSLSHGSAKMFGELPAGVALADSTGALTVEAAAFLTMMQQIMSGGSPVGIRPSGSKTDVVANMSGAHQVFSELALSREKAAARIYLGSDAILGSVGGAPGVDITALFAIASTILQGDLEVIEGALRTGVFEPWAAVNEGDSSYAPTLKYDIPDPDANAKSEESAGKRTRLFDALDRMLVLQLVVDQPTINALSAELGVTAPPVLSDIAKRSVQLPIDPGTRKMYMRVREARAADGLLPFGDERDDLTLAELEQRAKFEAKGTADIAVAEVKAVPSPAAAPPAPATPPANA